MPSKSLLVYGFKADADRMAEEYRAKLGLSKFSPLDAFQLADYLQVDIFSVDEIFSGKKSHPDYIKMSDTSRFSAMWLPNAYGEKIIVHNTNHSQNRQQSNLMHELAHIIRKHEIPDEQARLCAQFNLHYYNPLHEQEAKYLGGCLQVSRPGLLWALKYGYTVEQMSEYFNASIDMINYRLGITGVKKQRYYQSLKN